MFLDQPTVDSGIVTRGRSVSVAVGCWLFALQWHFNGTSRVLQRHFNGTSMALQWHFNGTSMAIPWQFNGTATALPVYFNGTSMALQQNFNIIKKKNEIEALLLTVSVERFSVSRMPDFCIFVLDDP